MAEVLITLGIIGIVAAMTLPSLIGNYQKKQTVVQLKKVYSIMSQAVQRAEVDHQSVEYWDFTLSSVDFSNIYIKPYYNILIDYDNTETGLLPDDYHPTCNHDGSNDCDGYGSVKNTHSSKFILTDGTLLVPDITAASGSSGYGFVTIMVDLNGFKNPNKYGRDIFMFSILPKNHGVQPYGVGWYVHNTEGEGEYDRDSLLNGDDERSCSKDGLFCAAVIMTDGWKIRNDYPW